MYLGLYLDKEAESLVFKGSIQGLNKCVVLLDTDTSESESLYASINTKSERHLALNDIKNENGVHDHHASGDQR
jgi:hypothetical protein